MKIWCFLSLFLYHYTMAFLPGDFTGFNDRAIYEVTNASRYDAETESDYLTYQNIDCQKIIVLSQQANYYCTSMGSIGSKRFLYDNYLLLTKKIHPSIYFRFHHINQEDFSQQHMGNYVEFIKAFDKTHHIGIHGQMMALKDSNDIGFSHNYITQSSKLRLEFNSYDFNRNHRNEQNDKFKKAPYSVNASLLKRSAQTYYYLALRHAPQFSWHQPDNSLTIKQFHNSMDFFVNRDRWFYSISSAKKKTWLNQSHESLARTQLHMHKIHQTFTYGLRFVVKDWKTNESNLQHQDLLGFLWHNTTTNTRLGYDLNYHQAIGDRSLSSDHDKSVSFEHRLNFSWNLIHTKTTNFRVLLTFDLDKLLTGTAFQGGNGQFYMNF